MPLLVVFHCQSKKQDSNLHEAYEHHKVSVKVRERVGERIENLNIEEHEKEILDRIKERLVEWDESFVEVPGFEHEHDHEDDHDHHHHHNPAPNLSAVEHLSLQMGLLEEIQHIENELARIAN